MKYVLRYTFLKKKLIPNGILSTNLLHDWRKHPLQSLRTADCGGGCESRGVT